MDIKSLNKKLLTQILLALFVLIPSLCLYDVQLMTPFSWFLLVFLLVIRCFTCPIAGENNDMEILNSSQNILNPGMEKTEVLYFKIPEKKIFTIEFQDGTFFSDTVSIKL